MSRSWNHDRKQTPWKRDRKRRKEERKEPKAVVRPKTKGSVKKRKREEGER